MHGNFRQREPCSSWPVHHAGRPGCTLGSGITNARRRRMLKFIGGTIGAIFLIGLVVVILLLMLIF